MSRLVGIGDASSRGRAILATGSMAEPVYQPRSPYPKLRSVALSNTVIGLCLLPLMYRLTQPPSLREVLLVVVTNQIYSHVIGMLASYTIPMVAVRYWDVPLRKSGPIIAISLMLIGAAGAAISVGICWSIGLIPRNEVGRTLMGSSMVAITATLIIGFASMAFEHVKRGIHFSTLELKQQLLEKERLEKLAAEAKLAALQSRLQPHVLFNTMNSILSLIREDPRAAEEMMQRLTRLLRYALDAQEKSLVTLSEEMKLVTDYLEVERTRFGSRLRFEIDLPAELESAEVPPYSVQTLVENSMKDAVAPKREGGEIGVSVSRDNGSLVIQVRDDGQGFSIDDMQQGHGLDTLSKRIELLFPGKGGLEIANHQGCRVTLRIPAGGKA